MAIQEVSINVERQRKHELASGLIMEGAAVDNSGSLDGRNTQRRRKNHGSSSFRLSSSFHPIQKATLDTPIHHAETRRTAKRPNNEPDLIVRKRHSDRRIDQEEISPINDREAGFSHNDGPERRSVDSAPSSGTNVGSNSRQSVVGIDTDPAQIVNLALSLGESRRRVLSGVVSGNLSHDRRLSTVLPSRSPVPETRIPHLREDDGRPNGQAGKGSLQDAQSYSQISDSPIRFFENSNQELDFTEFSSGTLARAEKAKRHFELFNEYLRLLPYLSPLQSPLSLLSKQDSSFDRGRVYNPLQYIRNRKVRFRERSPINSEEDGWQDVEHVHNWVDGVITSLDGTTCRTDECVQLPPLKSTPTGTKESSEPLSSPGRTNTNDPNKPRRPRMDWTVCPADLLADAAWVEAGTNKLKLENRDGKKIFPPDTQLKTLPLMSSGASPELPSIQQESTQLCPVEQLPSFTSIGSRGSFGVARGRKKHRFAHSVHLTSGPSHSRDSSKSGWRRVLTRSRSSSCSSLEGENAGYQSETRAKSDISKAGNSSTTRLPSDITTSKPDILPTSHSHEYAGSISSLDDHATNRNSRFSLEAGSSSRNSPSGKLLFPSITANLSPLTSREASPARHHGSLQPPFERRRRHKQAISVDLAFSGSDSPGAFMKSPSSPNIESPRTFLPELKETLSIDNYSGQNAKAGKEIESKRRGIFKGGRIAELVGNEVSKVGDLIRKKDPSGHSRRSSSASSVSEYIDADDDPNTSKRKYKAKPITFPVQSDPVSNITVDQQINTSKYHIPNLPVFRSTQNEHLENSRPDISTETTEGGVASSQNSGPQDHTTSNLSNPEVSANKGVVTNYIRPKLQATRNWSLSSHSIPKPLVSRSLDKKEIIRVRAHLLSTGIKGLEICRHTNAISSSSFNPLAMGIAGCSPSPLLFINEPASAAAATDQLLSAFDESADAVQKSISQFSLSDIPDLTSELDRLDRLITSSLNSRLRELSTEAEQLTGQLATTSTLAVKQLHGALDKGVRKRKRRFRWVSRFGYVLLEWVVVGVMWWLWTIVMIWKLLRGIWRGTMSGIRWVLWL